MHRLPVVTAMLVIDGGAMRDRLGKEGVAELTARALLEGTSSRSAASLALSLELLGTSVSAGADWDSTVLKMTVMSSRLAEALALMSEMVTAPSFPNESVQRLRRERLSEIIQAESDPRLLADEKFSQAVYGGKSRYSAPVAGTEQSISRIFLDDIRKYHEDLYRPGFSTLILAGDVDVAAAERIASEAFGKWALGPRSNQAPENEGAGVARERVHVVDRSGAQQSELRMGHAGVPRSCPDYFPLVVMNAVLGGLFSSRINLNLREVHGYTYGASSYFEWRRGNGPFVISTAVQSEVTGAAISEIFSEVEKLRSEKVSEPELSLATDYLAGVFPIRYETTDAVASGLANLVIFQLPSDYFATYRDRITAVTAEDVQKAAGGYLRAGDFTIVVAGNPALVEPQLTALRLGEVQVHRAR